MVFTLKIPNESMALPPPNLLNWCTVTCGLQGWMAALLDNAIHKKPILAAGIHQQILWTSIGFGIGYYLARRSSWKYAKRDREMYAYKMLHPEDFEQPEQKRFAEILQPWRPVR